MRGTVATLGLIVASAACHGHGALLEVRSQVAFDRVELFLASAPCVGSSSATCADGVAWESDLTAPPEGEIDLLIDNYRYDATARDGVARIALEPKTAEHVDHAVVIAFDTSGAIVAAGQLADHLTIPSDREEIWRIELTAASEFDVSGASAAQGVQQAHVWSRQSGLGSAGVVPDDQLANRSDCAVYQTFDGTSWQRRYYVPPEDPDCDNQSIECNPYWYDFASGKQTSLCLTQTDQPSGACVLGSSGCVDGKNTSTQCTPSTAPETCVPDQLCACPEPYSGSCLVTNMLSAAVNQQNTLLTMARCAFGAGPTGTCPVGSNMLEITLGQQCSDGVHIGDATSLPPPNSDTLTVGATVIHAMVTQTNPCTISLQWSGVGPETAIAAALALDPNASIVTILPVLVTFDRNSPCTSTPAQCTVLGPSNDRVFQCLHQ